MRVCRAEGSAGGLEGLAQSERGVVLLEWALIAFGCIIGFLIFFDTAAALADYLELAHIAGEGVRTGAKYPELEENRYTDITLTPAEKTACANGTATAAACGHDTMQDRMELMLANAGLMLDSQTVAITTEFIAANSLGTDEDDTVLVELNVAFDGILLSFPLTVTEQGPYLF